MPAASALVLFMMVVSAETAGAQDVRVSVNNVLNYGTGTELRDIGMTEADKEYFENFSDVRITADNVILGFRLEYSQPAEYGPDFSGFRRKFIGYRRDGLDLRIGDLYALHNRGLSLNLFEDRVIRYDTSLEGARAEYDTDFFRVKALAGTINYLEHLTFEDPGEPREEVYRLRSAALELKPHRNVRFGGSYTYAEGELPFFGDVDTVKTFIPEANVTVRLPFARLHAGYNFRRLDLNSVADSTTGGGFYGTISHSGRGYGVTLEYKNYSYDIVDPFARLGDPLRNTRMSPFQSPPIGHKEHSYSLMTRDPHLVNFNDEVGFFLEGFYSPMPRYNLNASLAMASLHHAWVTRPEEGFGYFKERQGPVWLPSLADERDPFWEIYLDFEYLFPDFTSYVKVAYNHRNRLFYNADNPDFSEKIRANTFAIDMQYAFTPVWSVKVISEHRFVHDSILMDDSDYYDQMLSVQIARSPSFSFGGRLETTTYEFDPSGEKLWYTAEASYRIGRSHTVMASYGKERGGFVCTNGVCRFVNAFDGFRFSLMSSF